MCKLEIENKDSVQARDKEFPERCGQPIRTRGPDCACHLFKNDEMQQFHFACYERYSAVQKVELQNFAS